jgi:hypothetical protein
MLLMEMSESLIQCVPEVMLGFQNIISIKWNMVHIYIYKSETGWLANFLPFFVPLYACC